MALDWNRVEFGGDVVVLAEKEFGANPSTAVTDRLYADWNSEGAPSNRKKWIRAKLSKIFIWAGEKPKWPDDVQEWPEHDGKPMAFLGQLQVPEFAYPTGHKSCESIVYVFGAPEGTPSSWRMITKTVEEFASLKGARVVKVIKGVDTL